MDLYVKNKNEIIAFHISFYGKIRFTLSVGDQSKYSADYAPFPDKITYLPYNGFKSISKHTSKKIYAITIQPVMAEGEVLVAKSDC
nr:aminotransferase class III-fold pyridoxal phosphate-dependent enzyme [Pantoea sp. Mhis]